MSDLKLVNLLHDLEIKVLLSLKKLKQIDFDLLVKSLKADKEQALKAVSSLKAKGLISVNNKLDSKDIKLMAKGAKAINSIKSKKIISVLTPELIKSDSFDKINLSKYDLKAPSPKLIHGSKHYANLLKDKVKQVFLEMGFKQVKQKLISSSFWNFDALFYPQDDPKRFSNSLLIKEQVNDFPEPNLLSRVKKTHESGWTTGSSGYGYYWDADASKKSLLVNSGIPFIIKELSNYGVNDLPVKIFNIGFVFVNQKITPNSLLQSQHINGLIADYSISLKNLLGFIKRFFNKLGFNEIRFKPSYCRYAEVSFEPQIINPLNKEWVGIGVAGLLRPEITKPLIGFDLPVIIWDLSFDKLLAYIYDIKDLRNTYSGDIEFIKSFNYYSRRFLI